MPHTFPVPGSRPISRSLRRGIVVAMLGISCLLAIRTTTRAQQQADVRQLIEGLRGADVSKRQDSARQLGAAGEGSTAVVDALCKSLESDESPDVRAAAAVALGRLKAHPRRCLPRLIKACVDRGQTQDQMQVWAFAGAALAGFGDQSVPLVRRMLNSNKIIEVRGGLYAIDQLGPLAAAAAPELIAELRQDDDRTRRESINGLMKIGPAAKESIPDLIKALDHEDFHTRYWSCRALGAMGELAKPAVPKLLEKLASDVASVRRNVAAALGNIGPVIGEPGVEALVAAMQKRNNFVREQGIVALGKLTPLSNSAQAQVERWLEDPNFAPRSEAARTLWLMDRTSTTPPAVLLRELKKSSAPWEAAAVLGDLGPEMNLVPQVAEVLKAGDPLVRQCAADALGRMGRAAAPQQAALRKALQDQDEEVREAAREALDRIAEALRKSAE